MAASQDALVRRQEQQHRPPLTRNAAQCLLPCGFAARGQDRFRTAFVQQAAAVQQPFSASLRAHGMPVVRRAQFERNLPRPDLAIIICFICPALSRAGVLVSAGPLDALETASIFNVVHLPPVQQVCRLVSAGALREHLLDALDEPKMPRARRSGHLAYFFSHPA